MFWKAIMLFLGLYLSFSVRNVLTDFQESIWIVASTVVVLVASLVVLPLTHMVQLNASVVFLILAAVLFVSTASVMGMMLVPKLFRLHKLAKSTVSSQENLTTIGSLRTTAGDMSKGSSTKRIAVTPASAIVDISPSVSGELAVGVFSILAAEVYGYPVSLLYVDAWLNIYVNESAKVGLLGYIGVAGIYTTTDFVVDSNDLTKHPVPLSAEFWRNYATVDDLIDAVSYSKLKLRTDFFPPKDGGPYCEDDTFGCKDHCYKTHACTLREDQNKECAVVILMYADWDPGYVQAVMSNLEIPTYFCFLGYEGTQNSFHFDHPGLFQRIALPEAIPERVALSTGTFGELGYGEKTTNPVDVDLAETDLMKFASLLALETEALGSLIGRFSIKELDMHNMIRDYNAAWKDPNHGDVAFDIACKWVKENYDVWSVWLQRLPLCTFDEHVTYAIEGCGNASTTQGVKFMWKQPDPDDPTKPWICDGGLMKLPQDLPINRSCDWVNTNPDKWKTWTEAKPECDTSFYTYTISLCDA
ncbi:hypothetical protein Poli38472_007712 [Pythium oligandrum]|uniref:G-protein coupled receptors family 3 profile domain-containing protein n=1 Tax=Pythium oligandrum TaxID=41045 RepID=A0A8K1FLA5_PYTOL|nr:hypothetical protein Poli38472_007712 [Pythium oligandrum]|eukprot:TMW68040.1 hypothetical protein Poli38472_007712 [Pythium oligandrum]